MDIKYVAISELKIPSWKATHILRPDLLVLSASLYEFGFIQPIHVRRETMEIIDGSERWLLASNVSHIAKKINNKIPVIFHDCDSIEAMMMHLRLNRGKGSLVAKKVSSIIRKLSMSGRYDKTDFDKLLKIGVDELELLEMGDLIKIRKVPEHTYSRAWVTIEAPSNSVDGGPYIERPPNSDR